MKAAVQARLAWRRRLNTARFARWREASDNHVSIGTHQINNRYARNIMIQKEKKKVGSER